MAAFWPRPYLVRPEREVAERFPDAWFGRPHVWYLPSPGDHDFVGQQRIYEAELALGVVAQIHQDAATEPTHELELRRQRDAAALLAWRPEPTFTQLFTLEAIGEAHRFDPDRLSVDAMRAALAAAHADVTLPTRRGTWSLREAWSASIAHRAETCDAVLAALRYAVPKLLEALAGDLDGRGCHIGSFSDHVPTREQRNTLAQELGLSETGDRVLYVHVKRVDPPFIDLEYAVRAKTVPTRRAKRVASGEVHVELARDGEFPTVESATLVAHERRSLV